MILGWASLKELELQVKGSKQMGWGCFLFVASIRDSHFPSSNSSSSTGFSFSEPIRCFSSATDSLEKPKTSGFPVLIYTSQSLEIREAMCRHLCSPHGNFPSNLNKSRKNKTLNSSEIYLYYIIKYRSSSLLPFPCNLKKQTLIVWNDKYYSYYTHSLFCADFGYII